MLWAGIKKDIQLLLRDRGALISMFALPLIFIGVFGSMFKFGPEVGQPKQIGIFYQVGDQRGVAIATSIASTQGFAVVEMATAQVARDAVVKESVAASLIVPADFAPAKGRPIELVIDTAAPIQVRGPLQGALTGAVIRTLIPMTPEVAAMLESPIAVTTPPALAKPSQIVSGFQISVPGNAVLFGFFIALTVAVSFGEEKRSGTWRRQLASPMTRAHILLAKLVPFFLISLVQSGFLFGLGALAFGLTIAGSIYAFLAIVVAVSLCAVSLGVLFASFGGSEKQLGSIGSVTTLVMGLIGGCMIPRMVMPAIFKQIGNAVPQSWALDGYFKVLIRPDTGLIEVAPQVAALLGFSLIFMTLGVARFKFE
jgi:ABC-2 type transport system permease protein